MGKCITTEDIETIKGIVRKEIPIAADDLKTAYGIKDPIALLVMVCGPDKEDPDNKITAHGHISGNVDALRNALYTVLMKAL